MAFNLRPLGRMQHPWGRARRLLLVEADLGRRATLSVALGTRYRVETAATADEALGSAVATPFDVAVLDASVPGRMLPRVVRILRGRSRAIAFVVAAGRRDLRGRHYAAMFGIEAVLGRPAPTHALLDRIAALAPVGAVCPPVDRGVARAIDLMARDVTHLLDVGALTDAIGVPLTRLSERFKVATGLGVYEYVARVRVAIAEQLLRNTDLGVQTLAELLGLSGIDELTVLRRR